MEPTLLLAADAPTFTIVSANEAYLAATMSDRDDLVGRPLFAVFPDNPGDLLATGTRDLSASLHRALQSRAADALAAQRYDIRRHHSVVTEFEERFWDAVNEPILGAGSVVTHIAHRVRDITRAVVDGLRRGRRSVVAPLHRTSVSVRSAADMTEVRDAVREACSEVGMNAGDCMDLLVAATELGRNMLTHAGGGTVDIQHAWIAPPRGLRLRFHDQGPGIACLARALAGGFSSAGTLGRGLSGTRALVDEFEVESGPHGTTVVVAKLQRRG